MIAEYFDQVSVLGLDDLVGASLDPQDGGAGWITLMSGVKADLAYTDHYIEFNPGLGACLLPHCFRNCSAQGV